MRLLHDASYSLNFNCMLFLKVLVETRETEGVSEKVLRVGNKTIKEICGDKNRCPVAIVEKYISKWSVRSHYLLLDCDPRLLAPLQATCVCSYDVVEL